MLKRCWRGCAWKRGAAAVAVLVLAGCSSETPAPTEGNTPEAVTPAAQSSALSPTQVPRDQFHPEDQPKRQTEQEKSQAMIDKNEEIIAKAEQGQDLSQYLIGLGNLYGKKMGNWKKAIDAYTRVIDEYPDLPGVGNIYGDLIVCYQQLNDQEGLNRLYVRMMEHFPEDSNEYKLAKSELSK